MPCRLLCLITLLGVFFAPRILAEDRAGQLNDPEREYRVDSVDGLVAIRWATSDLIKNPIAVSVDDQGRVFVTESGRRRRSDLDIVDSGIPIEKDLSFRSVEQRQRYYRSQDFAAHFEDLNGDGKIDWADLVIESEKVHQLIDTDGDGLADRATLFAGGFNTEVTGVAAGVLAHDGDVFVTVVPDLWQLRDTNGDGSADQREVMATGMGVHVSYAGHDMHGLTVGPDGKLYWTIGDKGINVTSKEGKTFCLPDTGCVMRCNPDGTEFEVFASGIRNIQEIAFDDFGNLFGVDNDADKSGEKERLVFLAEGSDSGWRNHYQYRKHYNPWTDERLWQMHFETQAAYILPPIAYEEDGPAGFSFNPGTALNDRFRHHFFVSHAPVGGIDAYTIEPLGAGFKKGKKTHITRAFTSIGSNFGPDGALYVADWAGTWHLNEEGAIWKIDDPREAHSPIRREVQALLEDRMTNTPIDELSELLGHPDQRVRLRAQFEVAKRGRFDVFADISATPHVPRLARVHAIWGLKMLRQADSELWLALLRDTDDEVRTQALQLFGQITPSNKVSAARLLLLTDANPRVRYHAAISLWKSADPAALAPLVKLIGANADRDPYLRHGGIMGLSGSATAQDLEKLKSHPSVAVRWAAVVALRRQRSSEVAAFLKDWDERVVAEAARAIHDDEGIPAAMPELAALLERIELRDEATIRRSLSANQRLGGADGARRLVVYASERDASDKMRVLALQLLEMWQHPSPLDTVNGMFVEPVGGSMHDVIEALRPHVEQLLEDRDDNVVQAALILADSLNVPPGGGELAKRVENSSLAPASRAAALAAMADSQHRQKAFTAIASRLLTSEKPILRSKAALLLASKQQNLSSVTDYLESVLASSPSQREIQRGLQTLGLVQTPRGDELLLDWLTRLVDGHLPPEYELDVYSAAKGRSGLEQIANLVERYESQLQKSENPAVRFAYALRGGDAAQGKYIFHKHEKAQCVRCHRIEATGSKVGPPLIEAGARLDRENLVESLVDPQAKIADGYGVTNLQLDDGRVLAGIIQSEDEQTVTLLMAEGQPVVVDKQAIELRSSPTSNMPRMDELLSPTELRDIVEYLSTLK